LKTLASNKDTGSLPCWYVSGDKTVIQRLHLELLQDQISRDNGFLNLPVDLLMVASVADSLLKNQHLMFPPKKVPNLLPGSNFSSQVVKWITGWDFSEEATSAPVGVTA
jgi:hypothetical protein